MRGLKGPKAARNNKPRYIFRLILIIAASVTVAWLVTAINHITKTHHEQQRTQNSFGISDTTRIESAYYEDGGSSLAKIPVKFEDEVLGAEKETSTSEGVKCSPNRRPYHVLLTAQSTTYQDWQARIMYHHFKKQQKLNPCTEMVNFTRLVSSKDGLPDALADEMPSIFTKSIEERDLVAKYGSFGVLNRPTSVVELVNTPEMMARIPEDYVFIAETDHLLFKDLPNLATESMPAGYKFGYMMKNPGFENIIRRHWPEGHWNMTEQTGPSPLLIHKKQLMAVAQPWLDISLALKQDPEADRAFGWVLEMWGYVIAAASLGIKHTVLPNFQIEPANLNRLAPDFWKDYYIYHYTYGVEYTMQGAPMMNTIGEWSLDKRHYGSSYPPKHLQLPPDGGVAKQNAAATWLCKAFNEATAASDNWPEHPTLGTVGWRREAITRPQRAASPIALMVSTPGAKWKWAAMRGFVFREDGVVVTPWGEGKWGVREDEFNCPAEHKDRCVYADFANGNHNLFFETDDAFVSRRIGDGDTVNGERDL